MECIRCTTVMNLFVDRVDGSGRNEQREWRCPGCGEVVRPIVTTSWIWWRAQMGRSQRTIFSYAVSSLVIRRAVGKGPAMQRPVGGDVSVLRFVPDRHKVLEARERRMAMNHAHTLVRYRLHRVAPRELPPRPVRKAVDRRK